MIFKHIEHLRNFILVCEKGSFAKAAEDSYISRQALSKSVSMLEKELGVRLFVRSKRGVCLTEIGEFVYREITPILIEMEEFQEKISEKINFPSEKTIKMNIFPSSIYLFSDQEIRHFFKTFSGGEYDVKISDFPTVQAREKLIAGELDIIIEAGYQAGKGLKTYVVKEFQRVCLVPQGNSLSQKDFISIDDLIYQNMVLCMNKMDFEYFTPLIQQKNPHSQIKFVGETNVMFELCSNNNLVGLNFDFVSKNLIPKYSNLVSVPFQDPIFPAQIMLIYNPYTIGDGFVASLGSYINQLLSNQGGEMANAKHYDR